MNDTPRTRIVLAALLLVAFALITLDYRGGASSPVERLRDVGAMAFGPIEKGAAAVVSPIASSVTGLSRLGTYQQRIRTLERQNLRLRTQLHANDVTAKRSSEVRDLMNLAGRGRYTIVPANVVAIHGDESLEHTAALDAGRRDGVKPDMTVVSRKGLVGRVTHAGATTSTALFANDPSSAVGARLEGSDEIGVVHGQGTAGMRLELLNPVAPVQPGDRLVTFGSQGDTPYVPGVPIGTVASVDATPGALTKTAAIRPFVDFTSLDIVGVVVKPPRRNPHDAVLPPRPKQGNTASAVPKPR